VLIDVVGVEERRPAKGREQVLGDSFDQRFGMAAFAKAAKV
jgi:hypothetical protein